MGACSRDQIRDEWQRSVSVLAETLGAPVVTASVPGGFYTRAVGEAAAAAGLRALFTSAPTTGCHRVDGCLVLGRYTLRRWSRSDTVAAIAAGAPLPRLSQWALYSLLNTLRAVAGDRYTQVRDYFWARR